MSFLNIAIDGPAGSGKSTIAKLVADKLKINYLDTGAMYRAITYKLLRLNVSDSNIDKIREVLKNTTIDIPKSNVVLLDGVNVADFIRTNDVSNKVSYFAKLGCVRKYCSKIQKDIATKGDYIMDGRDIGTIIMPNAKVKIWLTASLETRAKRRIKDLKWAETKDNIESLSKDIKTRDDEDSKRNISPLVKAKDAIEIDTSNLSIEEVVLKIVHIAKQV